MNLFGGRERPARCGLARDVRNISRGRSSLPDIQLEFVAPDPAAAYARRDLRAAAACAHQRNPLAPDPRPAPRRIRPQNGAPGVCGARDGLADPVKRPVGQAARAHQTQIS